MDIKHFADKLNEARTALFNAVEDDITADHALEDARNQAIIDGLIVGKNAEEREAKAAQVLADQIGAHRVTAAKSRYAKMVYDNAECDFTAAKYAIRLAEVEK